MSETQHNNLEIRQSALIRAMRFPLIVLVLIVHSPASFEPQTLRWSLDGWNVYHFVAEMISGHMAAIATRCFFLFSGFLFFRYLKDGEFSFKWIWGKWQKRIWSLLVPFLIWNLLMILAVILKNEVFGILSIGKSPDELALIEKGPLYWFLTGPADFPLWFLRDLILMTLVAPLLYPIFKRFRWVTPIVLIILYLSPLSPGIPSMQAIVFFCIGAWMGIHRLNMLTACRSIKVPAAIIAVILLFISTSLVGQPYQTFSLNLFIPFGIITFINICDSLISNDNICKRLCQLSASVFFIYAVHEIYILGWTKGLFLRVFGHSLAGTWISYLFVPVVVLFVCLGLYYLLNRLMPHAMAIACGGRNETKQ